MNKLKLNLLTNSLPITAYGFENTSMATQIMSVNEYINHHKNPYYCECIILPDGRVVLARPSHMAVLDSLLNYIQGSTFVLSPYWFVEERLYYTDSILVWKERFDTIVDTIKNNNQRYAIINQQIRQTEVKLESIDESNIKNKTDLTDKINRLKQKRWQFIHDYATTIHDILIQNVANLEPYDLSPLDLVPYTVWKKVPQKTVLIIDAINKAK